MNNKAYKPLLLAGIIMATIYFATSFIDGLSALVLINNILSLGASAGGATSPEILELTNNMAWAILLFVIATCGLIFSIIALVKNNISNGNLNNEKSPLIAIIVIGIVEIVFEIINLFRTKFDLLTFLMIITLIIAVIFIAISFNQNKKILEETASANKKENKIEPMTDEEKQVQDAVNKIAQEIINERKNK